MPPRRQLHISDTSAVAYRSTACRIGTHSSCTESYPASVPDDLPVVYEACACPCHSSAGPSMPTEVTR
ncbi:hypothetical protein C5746_17740 [Streptomyces atratus]|uniref:Uncharacterized protein n=1 Tax=Streptomyces atratus TaxID=1893 RepID=A0A2Z5JRB3_STRAR|nr:hypothetical protein C5746_17740 [Streptomyces atratus]